MGRRRNRTGNPTAVRTRAALLLVDVVNDMDFPGSGPLVRAAERMAPRLARLAQRCRQAGLPVVYVNDNFGQWRSDWRKVVDRCVAPTSPGRRVSQRLRPAPRDFFVLKPKHSGFFGTVLDLLLAEMGVRTVILAGVATDICILFTANDAYMRGYRVVVPRDCVAANTRARTEYTLRQVREVLDGRTPSARSLAGTALRTLARGRRRARDGSG